MMIQEKRAKLPEFNILAISSCSGSGSSSALPPLPSAVILTVLSSPVAVRATATAMCLGELSGLIDIAKEEG